MKKRIFFVLLLLVGFLGSLKSQQFVGGLRFGLNASQVRGDLLSGFDKAGLNGGITLMLPWSDKDQFQLEFLFTQKGSRRNPTKDSYQKYIMRLNYFEIPFSYFRLIGEKWGIQIGLSFAYLMKNSEIEWDENGLIPSSTPFNKLEWAGHAGLFYRLSQKSQFSLRYSNSILPIRPYSSGQTYYMNLGQSNQVLTFAYEFRF